MKVSLMNIANGIGWLVVLIWVINWDNYESWQGGIVILLLLLTTSYIAETKGDSNVE